MRNTEFQAFCKTIWTRSFVILLRRECSYCFVRHFITKDLDRFKETGIWSKFYSPEIVIDEEHCTIFKLPARISQQPMRNCKWRNKKQA